MAYKVTDEELDAAVQDWPKEWCKPLSVEEVSTGAPTDAPKDPVREAEQ